MHLPGNLCIAPVRVWNLFDTPGRRFGLPVRGAGACDVDARRLLGRPRASSVFPAPIRAVLSNGSSHAELSALHRRIDGRGLTKQAFHIPPKIREVDRWLIKHREERVRVHEIHPEVSFAIWNDARPMRHHKSTGEGREERERLIRGSWPDERERLWSGLIPAGCAQVDLNDAIAALWSARRIGTRIYVRLPDQWQQDETGLKMQIVEWAEPTGQREMTSDWIMTVRSAPSSTAC